MSSLNRKEMFRGAADTTTDLFSVLPDLAIALGILDKIFSCNFTLDNYFHQAVFLSAYSIPVELVDNIWRILYFL